MRSYLEITWLLNSFVCAGIWSFTSLLHKKNISKIKLYVYSVMWTGLCWMAQKARWSFVLHLFFGVLLYGRSLVLNFQSSLMMSVVFNLLGYLNCFAIQNGLLYCDATSGKWMIVVGTVIFLMVFGPFVSVLTKQSELYVPIHLESQQDVFSCIGYLDTGNCVMHQKLPVVFVKKRIECNESISVQSVTGLATFDAVKATLSMENKKFDVMMAYAPDLQVECLLHVMMK